MALLIRAEEVTGILTMEEAIDAVEAGFREFGRNPELNAPRRRIMTPDGVRVSVHPGGVPSLGGIGLLTHAEHVAVSKEVQTYHSMGGPVTVLFNVKDASGTADADSHGSDECGRDPLARTGKFKSFGNHRRRRGSEVSSLGLVQVTAV